MYYDDKTLKDRTITIKMTDQDCVNLMSKAWENGLTVPELLQSFVGDLVCGAYTNGSDERMMAEDWFDRCGFQDFASDSLIRHLIREGIDPEDFLTDYDESFYYECHPEEYAAEKAEDPDDPLCYEVELREALSGWAAAETADMEAEVERVRQYVREWDALMGRRI